MHSTGATGLHPALELRPWRSRAASIRDDQRLQRQGGHTHPDCDLDRCSVLDGQLGSGTQIPQPFDPELVRPGTWQKNAETAGGVGLDRSHWLSVSREGENSSRDRALGMLFQHSPDDCLSGSVERKNSDDCQQSRERDPHDRPNRHRWRAVALASRRMGSVGSFERAIASSPQLAGRAPGSRRIAQSPL
jgi:hypothetical protein